MAKTTVTIHAWPCQACGGGGWNNLRNRPCGVCKGSGTVSTPGK